MPLETVLKLLSAAKFPLAVGFFGLVLNLGGSNLFLKDIGAGVGLMSVGCAVATGTKRNGQLREIERLTDTHNRQTAALKSSVNTALADVATAQQELQKHAAIAQHAKGVITQLESTVVELKGDAERLKAEILAMGAQVTNASTQLGTCTNDNSLLAGKLEALEVERMALIYELYETAVTEMNLGEAIASLESQFQNDSAYQISQKKKLKSEVTKARANFHTEIAELQERNTELEAALAKKTKLAQEMLGELESDANGAFTQLGGKAGAQAATINGLKAQIEELRKTNKALTHRRFDTVGTDNAIGNRLIDALAKHGSIYGAFSHEREGHNGRLKVWLTLIDAPLQRAKDALDDMEAELKLWAKPSVKVDRGMHLFTLATEQEHKVLSAPKVPLTRLEKTLDNAIHARIVGGSGSGKTVLLNNLMHYMAASMKGANVTLLDPKAVDDWGMFTPRYWGEECVTGIVELSNSLKGRVSNTVKARKAGKPSPDYSPELFILDEAQYNYLLAQNADASHIKEKGEVLPNYAKKAKGALAGLLSLGRAYNAIGLFVTQLPQVSKVGLNEGSFDPCVNIFLGKQIDNAISSFLPGCGFTDTKCKGLAKELDTRRKLGQRWLMLVADLPTSEAYLMECPAPGYYHNRFSQDLEGSPVSGEKGEGQETTVATAIESGDSLGDGETPPNVPQASPRPLPATKPPAAHCPKCKHKSVKLYESKPKANGKYRFVCENSDCEKGSKKGTFSAFPLA